MTRYLILGNGAAGATAAEEIRTCDPRGSISIVNAESYPMYSRPGLAYVIINEIPDRQVIARRPEWYAQKKISVVHGTAAKVDVVQQQVLLADRRKLPYDKLLIATGARAVPLPYPGANLDGVVFLDTLDGTKELLRKVKGAKRAVVIGGGITALELAEGLAHHRLDTHYFLRKARLWSIVFNEAESKLLEERMKEHGVKIHFNTEITEVIGDQRGRVAAVKLAEGPIFPCDLIGAGIGVKPQLALAQGTPIKVDRAILVNEYLETNVPNVYAAGDCAQIWDRWTQTHTLDVLWPTAIAGGRIAGANMTGAHQPYLKGTPFNACLLFGLHITAIGQLDGSRDETEPEVFQHLSRGASEVWATRPRAYASAWSQQGLNTIRLTLSGDRLVGALIIGQQTLADPLRDLIEKQVDIRPLRPYLQTGGPTMGQAIQTFWARLTQAGNSVLPEAEVLGAS